MQSNKEADVAVVAAISEELASLRKNPPSNSFLLRTGVGEANAERALRSVLDGRRVRMVIHIGFAGALSPDVRVGDVVIAHRVQGSFSDSVPAASLELAARLKLPAIPIHFGTAVTVSDFLWKAEAKRALAASVKMIEPAWADMESAAVARICVEREIPFVIARAITDLVEEDLPLDLNRCRKPDGDLSRAKILVSALAHPSAIRKLIELRRRSALCAARLDLLVRQLCNLVFSPSA
ncbi:MAG TPA: hypothetical protein VLR94_03865 [Acidobacteriota bacterium]|nr:hypothetical protein [Acidobacteriota bacterium]